MANGVEVEHERELRENWQAAHLEVHSMLDRALAMARDDVNRRLDGMNELRQQIASERGFYLSRELFDREHSALRDAMDMRLKVLENRGSNLDGRLWAVGAVISFVVSAVVIAINLVLRK